jgi:homoserine kinase type II
MISDPTNELKEILSQYDLGELLGFEKDVRGTVNTSYTIEIATPTGKKRYFLRRYKWWIKEEELIFEHSVITHLMQNGFDLAAGVLKTRDGRTYIRREGEGEAAFYALFEFLHGDDKYTWIDPICEASEIVSSAETLARFHQAMAGWKAQGKRQEPRIVELLPTLPGIIVAGLDQKKGTVFDDYLAQNKRLVNDHIEATIEALKQPRFAQLPQVVAHCDYHPGNLKFSRGKVVGLFDFDWSKIETRTFDIGLALVYFFSSWKPETDGQLRLDEVSLFLGAYQATLKADTKVGPLTGSEQQSLPFMIQAGNLYVLNWALLDFYQKEVDADEYLVCLHHHVRMIPWIEDQANRARLKGAIAAGCNGKGIPKNGV